MPRRASLQRFENLWSRCCDRAVASNGEAGADSGHASSALGADLLERYAETGRRYHTIEHINHCLGQFDRVRAQCTQPDAVELAIWFHDAIYNFPAYENEKLSAAFFMEKSEHLLDNSFRRDVEALIIATEHIEPPKDPDQQILVDVDLSSFGLPWDQFAADGKNIRKELHYLADTEFYAGQIAFMESLQGRASIFNTAHFFDSYEAQARENVGQYLDSLAERGFVGKDR